MTFQESLGSKTDKSGLAVMDMDGQETLQNQNTGTGDNKQKRPLKAKRLIVIALSGFGVMAAILLWITVGLPNVQDLKKHNPSETELMRYRDAQYKKKGIRVTRHQRWVQLSSVSPALIQAVLISEDDKFYNHDGFDWEGIHDALEKNLRQRRIIMGGSTISQQLVKNLYLTPDRNPVRKIQEALITARLEKTLSKRRILELYLNVIEWGRGIYGIEAVSQAYYAKSASDLTLAEAIRLASVLPNPIRYSPVTDSSKRQIRRRQNVARRMLQKHLIDDIEYRILLAELEGRPIPVPVEALPVSEEPAIRQGDESGIVIP